MILVDAAYKPQEHEHFTGIQMYAVIFNAEIATLDEEYSAALKQMRQLAVEVYGCQEITSHTSGTSELTISYWQTQEQITKWKENTAHLAAQMKGRNKWYKSYKVQIVELVREYRSESS